MSIETHSICKAYKQKGVSTSVIHNFNHTFQNGNLYVIKGESGSGKSTLLSMLSLIQPPDSGTILFNGKDTSAMSEDEQYTIRREQIGFVFQEHNLFAELTALDNVCLVEACMKRVDIDMLREKARCCLDSLGLLKKANINIRYLSGGERQRVSVARALYKNPLVCVFDEPISNLDEANAGRIVDLLSRLSHEENKLVIVSCHSKAFDHCADETIYIDEHGSEG